MKLSRKARFGITAMIRLGLRDGKGTQTLSDLSMDQGISLSYLEQLFAQLRKRGLVVGVRGPGGGYRLACKPEQIRVSSIITAVDKEAYPTEVSDDQSSSTEFMWAHISHQLFDYLDQLTLADVLHGYQSDSQKDTLLDHYPTDKVA